MGKQIVTFIIKKASVMNFIYKIFQTLATTLVLAGIYSGWAIGGEVLKTPKRLDKIERRVDKHDSLLCTANEKLDQIIKAQELKRKLDSALAVRRGR